LNIVSKIHICFFAVYSILWNYNTAAQYTRPSNIRVSLLTVDPGNKFYSIFGHSAIRVKIDISNHPIFGRNFTRIDSSNHDMVYNYGMFSYIQPDFYYDFVTGKMIFHMTKEPYDKFISKHKRDNRGVREHVFAINSAQAMFIFHYLENNNKNVNRYFQYHFFHDNCATRIRDLMLQTFDGMTLPESKETPTYRDQCHLYLKNYPWVRFGIDIAFGLPLDHKTDIYEQMFLPDNMNDIFAKALFHGQPIVKETINIFVSEPHDIPPSATITPTIVCCFILALAIFFFYVKKGSKVFDFVLFFTVGIVGLLAFFLWFFTDHTTTVNNLNIIWALPTHFVMAFFLIPERHSGFTRKYFMVTAIIALMLIVSWVFLPQRLNPALIPLTLAIALRSGCIYKRNSNINTQTQTDVNQRFFNRKVGEHPPVTFVDPEQTEIELNDLRTGKTSEAIFTLKNTGTQPLIIQTVNAFCGCTVPEWEKQPIAAGNSTKIKVQITPEEKGYFNKTITVHCNIEEGQISLKVKGIVEQ
jgi:hypothetical protein